ncbi:MAG: tautomerase family protein [Sphingomonadales bacterium]|nr:tautomerase family protein [Sphingomonadales bacterium]
MPIISVVIAEGRTEATKRRFIRAITEATVEALAVRPDQVRVMLNELPLGHYAVAGKTFAEREEDAAALAVAAQREAKP